MLSALTEARIWTKKTTPTLSKFLLHQQPQKAVFLFLPLCPCSGYVFGFFLFHKHKAPGFQWPFGTLSGPREVDDVQCTGTLPCASPLSRSCCVFSSLIPQGHLFKFFCVCVFSWRKNSGSPPFSMKFHKKYFLFSSAGHSHQKFEWCHHCKGASLFLGPYSEKCPSSLVNQGLLLYILFWVLFPLVKMAILNNWIPCTAHGGSWKP